MHLTLPATHRPNDRPTDLPVRSFVREKDSQCRWNLCHDDDDDIKQNRCTQTVWAPAGYCINQRPDFRLDIFCVIGLSGKSVCRCGRGQTVNSPNDSSMVHHWGEHLHCQAIFLGKISIVEQEACDNEISFISNTHFVGRKCYIIVRSG